MAFNLASVSVRLIADTGRFVSEMGRSERKLVAFGRVARTAAKGGIGAVVAAVGLLAADAFKTSEQIRGFALQIGKSVEDLQKLKFVAEQNQVSFGALATALQRIQRRAGDANEEGAELRKAFAELGIEATAFSKLGALDQVLRLSQAFRGLEQQQLLNSKAFKLLDVDGQTLLRFLKLAPKEILATANRAEELGMVSEQVAKNTKTWSDRFGDFMGRFKGAATQTLAGNFRKAWDSLTASIDGTATATQKAADAQRLFNLEQQTTISAAEKAKLLGPDADSTTSRQIDVGRTFLSRGAPSRPQEIRAKQLDEANQHLAEIKGLLRNNATGRTVAFTG